MQPIDSNPSHYLLGIDVGGTKTALVLGTLQADVLLREAFPTPATQPFEAAMQVYDAAIRPFLAKCAARGQAPFAISVAVGGPLDIDNGILYAPPHLASWGEAHLKAYLVAQYGLPVFVEHDGNAGALAEYLFGAGRGTKNAIFLTMGKECRSGGISVY
jgi:glucokinase